MATVRKVIVADRSPTVRALLRRFLSEAGLVVEAESENVSDLVSRTAAEQPDAVVLDAELPGGGAPAAAAAIVAGRPVPLLVMSSRRAERVVKAFDSLGHGAAAVFAKPETPEGWRELGRALVQTLQHLDVPSPSPHASRSVEIARRGVRWVLVGASTGGPVALRDLLSELRGARLGVAAVQHIAAGFEDGLAQWLARETGLDVAVAAEGETLHPGLVRLARPGAHLVIGPGAVVGHDAVTPPRRGHRPSIDRLFETAATLDGSRLAAVLLTGMGDDGARGLLELRRAGALTLVQDRSTCSVAGMPSAALQLDAAELELDPRAIGRSLAASAEGAR